MDRFGCFLLRWVAACVEQIAVFGPLRLLVWLHALLDARGDGSVAAISAQRNPKTKAVPNEKKPYAKMGIQELREIRQFRQAGRAAEPMLVAGLRKRQAERWPGRAPG